MMKSKTLAALLAFALGGSTTAGAQAWGQRMILAPMDIFVPHWQAGASVGAGYDLGEGDFVDLLSPTFQLTGAYHFSEFLAARLSLSGMTARNRYADGTKKYAWKYIQPAIELQADLASLFSWWDADRKLTPYAVAGVGMAYSFANDDVTEAVDKDWTLPFTTFNKLWRDHRWNPVVRAGLGAEYWLSEKLALTVEANANMLPDGYNSKAGDDSFDWRFNALVGIRFRLGDYRRKTPPVYQQYTVVAEPSVRTQYITREQADMAVNIHFDIGLSTLRPSEQEKLNEIFVYLNNHPERHILITGYADQATGTPEINERLSKERAQRVAAYLRERGIPDSRIHADYKGDRIQPFDFPAANRVCVCIILNPEYL